ncbi:MAG: glycosyltransferase [Thermoleophilaceae bacterium]
MSKALVVAADVPFPVVSGGRKRMVRLLEAMERAGARPHLLVADGTAGDGNDPDLSRRGWSVESFPRSLSVRARLQMHARGWATPPSPALERRLGELLDSASFVQFEEVDVAQYAPLAARQGVPTLVSLHNVDSQVRHDGQSLRERYRRRRMADVERRAARDADALLCVSGHDYEYFEAHGARRPVLVPNGVDDDFFALPDTPPATQRVFFFGQFAWPPNADGMRRFAEEGWGLVRETCPDAELRIAGPGSADALGDLARIPGVEVLGFVDDLIAELAQTRAVVVPVWSGGGTRIKVLEALAAARPVAGTPVGIERLGFEHGVHGLVAESPQELAQAVVTLIRDDATAAGCARAGRELAGRYRWSSVTRPAEELYARLLYSSS